MRTNIEIDDKLMAQAKRAFGAATKREAVEEAMRFAVQIKRQERALDELASGKYKWTGNLNAMRRGR